MCNHEGGDTLIKSRHGYYFCLCFCPDCQIDVDTCSCPDCDCAVDFKVFYPKPEAPPPPSCEICGEEVFRKGNRGRFPKLCVSCKEEK